MIKRIAERFFKWYCHPDYYEDIKGDLNELFARRQNAGRTKIAGWLFALATGVYPAFVLSSFRPIGVLQGNFGRSKQGVLLRKSLVVVQFAASLILITGTVIVYQQIRYMTNKDLGIHTDQVIGFRNAHRNVSQDQYISQYRAFTEELSKLPGIEKVAGISALPGGGSAEIGSSSGGVRIVGQTELIESTVYINSIDDRLQDALGMEILSGRNFNRDFESDTAAVMLNQSFLDLANIKNHETILNEYIQFGSDPDNDKFLIVGIVNDYYRSTMKKKIEPTVFFHNRVPTNTVVKLDKDKLTAGINTVQNTWKRFYPEAPFSYSFLDQRFEQLYQEDRKFGWIFFNFSLLAVFIASIGLFGLSSHMAVQRTKEVGVRKVLGATINNIVLLFFREFLWLILIAVLIGIPLVYLSMNNWLNSYAYRIAFPWGWLVMAVIAIVILAFFTVSYQTWRLARLNPAQTVRQE